VPRFASFNPRQTASDTRDEDTATSSRSQTKPLEKEHFHHSEARHRRHRRRHDDRHGREERTDESHSAPAKASQLYPEYPSSKARSSPVVKEDINHFVEDRRSDENNIRYGTSNRHTVPKYREAGRHGLLGLSRLFKTTPEEEPGRRLITTERLDYNQRHATRSLRTGSVKESELSWVAAEASNNAETDARSSYLPLTPHRSRKRRKLSNTNSATNHPLEALQEDRSQCGHDRFADEQDSDSLSTSSGSELDPTSNSSDMSSTRAHHVRLSRLVNEDPSDVNAWLALIQHQDIMLADDPDGPRQALTNAQQQGLADVKLSMYEKALTKTKGHPSQDRLVLGMMTEGAKIWETNKLAKEWRSMLKQYPNSLGLWVQYLIFQQTNFVTFKYESCREIFKNCLDVIAKKQATADVDRIRTYVFLRTTIFMREAGFSEHAHALWQGILEYTFFEPSNDQVDDELFSFEDFWDSEVSRVGEERARGWRMSQRVNIEPSVDPSLPPMADGNLFETWNDQEGKRMRSSVLAARTLDEVDEDDPFRVILFSDIQPFLFCLSGLQSRQELLEAFLCFCGLPPLHLGRSTNRPLLEDPLLSYTSLDPNTTLDHWLITSENHPFSFPLPSFVTDTATTFARDGQWFNPWNNLPSVLSNQIRSKWIQRSLRLLQSALPDDDLFAKYVLAFESRLDVKEGRKYAKTLLKHQPSIRLYNDFALLEHISGNMKAAERIWSTALCMRSSFSKTNQRDTIVIWRSWLWALVDDKDFSRALRLCLAVPDETLEIDHLTQAGMTYLERHPTSKLRTHQYLVSLLDQSLSMNNQDLSIHFLDVLALFTYLTSSHNLTSSLKHYSSASSHPTISQSPSTLSLLHQSRARLLHLHATTSSTGFRPSDITTPLAESIRLFPTNTIFLSLYHYHTRRSLLVDRIRDVIPNLTISTPSTPSHQDPNTTTSDNTTTTREASIIPPLFTIYTELHRPTFAGTTSHSIRAAFEKALTSDGGGGSPSPSRHSPRVWTLYLLWEIHVASSKSDATQHQGPPSPQPERRPMHPRSSNCQKSTMDRAIALLHRAIRACPWCKELYLLAFRIPELRSALREGELRALYEMLLDKGLRVHVELRGEEGG
jgi:NRDE-2, necessary for RNA interference